MARTSFSTGVHWDRRHYKGQAQGQVQHPADATIFLQPFSANSSSASPRDNLFQCCTILTVRKVFLMSKVNFPWCNLSPLLLVVLMHTEYSLLLSSVQRLFMYLKTVVMTPLSLLFLMLNNLSNMYTAWFLRVLSSWHSHCFYSGDWEWKNFSTFDDQAVLSGALYILIGMKGTNAVYSCICVFLSSQ